MGIKKMCLGYNIGAPYNLVNTNGITLVKLQNGIFDNIYVTLDTSLSINDDIKNTWDKNTVLTSDFNGNSFAGNVDFSFDNISDLLIKRRETGTFKWQTIYQIPITKYVNTSFVIYDKYAKAGKEYEYALVAIDKDTGAEGNYHKNTVLSRFEGIYVIGADKTIHTILNTKINSTRNKPFGITETLNSKKPYYFSNSKANYMSGTVEGLFIEMDCDPNVIQEKAEYSHEYRMSIYDFLTDEKPKILKDEFGKIALINVTSNIESNQWDVPYVDTTSFSFTETGNYASDVDMKKAGLINVDDNYLSS